MGDPFPLHERISTIPKRMGGSVKNLRSPLVLLSINRLRVLAETMTAWNLNLNTKPSFLFASLQIWKSVGLRFLKLKYGVPSFSNMKTVPQVEQRRMILALSPVIGPTLRSVITS